MSALQGYWNFGGHGSEDTVQAAFAKLYLRWDKLTATGAVESYVRRVVLTSMIDDGRRGWFRREAPTPDLPDRADQADLARASTDRLAVLAALAQVPPRQRAVLVLRYWEDLSIEQVAQLLACTEGTVKSQAARGLDRLRALLDPRKEEAV
jgi:RNA polymerase sigma-70 factor (sigma-E family)